MHAAMLAVGWSLPPFRDAAGHARRGWLKYGICSIAALVAGGLCWKMASLWLAWFPALCAFYAVEARMVFLFPEALRGRRHPWREAHGLTSAAGGTLAVMSGVLPIAARMLAAGWWRGRGREMWVQGCLAVVLWHRAVVTKRPAWTEDAAGLGGLEWGSTAPLLLRRERIYGRGGKHCRVMWISDLHWRGPSDAGTLLALLQLLRRERPDLCILGGDFAESRAALGLVQRLAKGIARVSRGIALPGNHDRGPLGEAVRAALIRENVTWLPDAGAVPWKSPDGACFEVVGADAPPPASGVARIVAVHDPAELDETPPAPGSLVLAGHLHGGQCVLSSRDGRLLPAAWIYPHAWLRREHAGSCWIMTRGAGDTLPLRWNCPREVILCEIIG